MARLKWVSLSVALSVLIAGCGQSLKSEPPQPGALNAAPEPGVMSGFAVYGHEVRAFRPCDADEKMWVSDPSGLLWELHRDLALHREPYEEVFAIVEGRRGPPPTRGLGAGYAGTLEVTGVRYAALEGIMCNVDLSEFRYRASGNEPFWMALITAEAILVKMPGREDRFWRDIRMQEVGGGIRFEATGPAGPVVIRIADRPCRDSMSGAYFAYSAGLSLDGTEFTGCVLRGTAPAAE
jgi:uncharacterized membrane protein